MNDFVKKMRNDCLDLEYNVSIEKKKQDFFVNEIYKIENLVNNLEKDVRSK